MTTGWPQRSDSFWPTMRASASSAAGRLRHDDLHRLVREGLGANHRGRGQHQAAAAWR
jgi:hypothetical protein